MANNKIQVIHKPEPPKGNLNLMHLYCLSIGQVIGAGVITLIGPAITATGYSAWLGYALAVILGFICICPTVTFSGTLRFTGGYYSMIGATCPPVVAGMYAVSQLTNMLSLSLFGVSIGLYINSVFPTVNKTVAGIALLTLFWLVNLTGVDIMAWAQTFMTWVLIACLLMFIIMGLVQLRNPIFDTSDPQWMPNGAHGLIASVLLYVYSTRGYSMTINYGKDAKNATRDIPIAILLSVPTIMVLYTGTAMVGCGILPLEVVADQPLTLVAQEILPGVLFPLFIIGGPIMALLTTMNSSIPATAAPMLRSVQDGWFPRGFGALNKRGVAWKIITVHYILGLIPMLLGFDVETITNNIMLLGAIQSMLYQYAYYRMPTVFPEAWKKSKYHMPNSLYYIMVTLSTAAVFGILFQSFSELNIGIALFSTIASLACMAYGYWRSKTADITMEVSCWPPQD